MITYNPNLNYCSMSPDSILGVKINHGCYLHDRHYRDERMVRLSRAKADLLLGKCIFRDMRKVFPVWFAFLTASVYYIVVRLFAGRAYK